MDHLRKIGTAPVFFTAISTILGAILFLRFGFAVGTLGFWGAILIILLGHLVTIPTALAISEIATNKRVEGGGEYFIISRSFGLNIGATIGIALFMSQAISVAFYIIAFTEAFEFFFDYVSENYGILLPRQSVSIPVMIILAIMIITKGANLGIKALYLVVAILFISLVMFFLGESEYAATSSFSLYDAELRNPQDFFIVFAIVFPAFTGMTAGVGLSGDLKRPSRSIPIGTILATFSGLIVYFFIVYKLAQSASVEDLLQHQLIMKNIAIGGAFIIPIGLAASTISSALGSVMVAPRTLQALALDRAFPSKRLNRWLATATSKDNEPKNASFITAVIAFIFVGLGDVNAVASIISMFFMVTYGSLCLISFLNHFGSSPSYRPTFRSRWYISLTGFLVSVWVMFKINTPYALLAIAMMTLIYLFVSHYHKDRSGLAALFTNTVFQLNRNLQIILQNSKIKGIDKQWRPSAICISKDSFERDTAFRLLNWISYRYGFGTYIHRIVGYYSKATSQLAREELQKLIVKFRKIRNHVYIDTLISPSYTASIAQAIQIPGIAGMENNMVIFEYDRSNPKNILSIIDNFSLVSSGDFDICILGSSDKPVNYKNGVHVWIDTHDAENSNLMILLSYIIAGHPDWRRKRIRIFVICKPDKIEETEANMTELLSSGRLPITRKNIEIIIQAPDVTSKSLINERSKDAGLTMIGVRKELLNRNKEKLFDGYENMGNILFVYSKEQKGLE